MRKNETLPFAAMWMELEGIRLSEISQSEKDRYHMFSLICVTEDQGKGEKQLQTEREGGKP